MIISMPWAMYAFAPGFAGIPGKQELAVELARITFIYLLFISVCALFAGISNALGRFAAGAAAPVLLNVISIFGLVSLMSVVPTPGHALAWGVAGAGIIQVVWLGFVLRRTGFLPRFVQPVASPRVRLLLIRMIPAAFGAGLYQIGLVVDIILASFLQQGSVSWLNFADRINQLPLGVVGIAIGTALLPLLSRQISAGNTAAALESQRSRDGIFSLTDSAGCGGTCGLSVSNCIHHLRAGCFYSRRYTCNSACSHGIFCGIAGYVLVKVLLPGFFSRGDTRTRFPDCGCIFGSQYSVEHHIDAIPGPRWTCVINGVRQHGKRGLLGVCLGATQSLCHGRSI